MIKHESSEAILPSNNYGIFTNDKVKVSYDIEFKTFKDHVIFEGKEVTKDDGTNLRLLRIDGLEADELAGHHLKSSEESAAFAASLVARGVAQTAIIARGAEGSVMATKHGQWLCKAADVPVISKVGAGDSFMGAFVLAMAQGADDERALASGVAASSAAVMTEATELCRATDAFALIAE